MLDNMDAVQIDKCFGFDTAVEEAQTALLAAKVEASSADQGIGLVKLMGRSSGFIAMQASMASGLSHFLATSATVCPIFCNKFLLLVLQSVQESCCTESPWEPSWHQASTFLCSYC